MKLYLFLLLFIHISNIKNFNLYNYVIKYQFVNFLNVTGNYIISLNSNNILYKKNKTKIAVLSLIVKFCYF